ncbi:hypothetical protein SAMN05216167_1615 [Spirosoma endophyticum]|uniref:Immunity protein 50 n=1 Tax=Spirosoma endophyticum TaxID=662367 RepID=A0A1I2IE07_9BACT|nr:hypothetical protein SAMN05216167_1615 [Spirosoma endophyticum]
MLAELVDTYERFSDALILTIHYANSIDNGRSLDVIIHCMNKQKDYEWETVKLSFMEISKFRFIENERTSSTVINSALLKNEQGQIIIDFFPFIYDDGVLKENPSSDFSIRCRSIKYELLN